MKIDRAETLRYLRMGGVEPDAPLARRLARVEDDVRAACRPAAYWRLETVSSSVRWRSAPATSRVSSRAAAMRFSSVRRWVRGLTRSCAVIPRRAGRTR